MSTPSRRWRRAGSSRWIHSSAEKSDQPSVLSRLPRPASAMWGTGLTVAWGRIVLVTAAAAPAAKAAWMASAFQVSGPEASTKGLGSDTPHRSTLRSAISPPVSDSHSLTDLPKERSNFLVPWGSVPRSSCESAQKPNARRQAASPRPGCSSWPRSTRSSVSGRVWWRTPVA